MKRIFISLLLTMFILVTGVFILNQQLIASTSAAREASEHFQAGRFVNDEPVRGSSIKTFFKVLKRYFTEKKIAAEPDVALPVLSLSRAGLEALSTDTIHIVKLGHSSVLMKVYGEYWLFDPVFAERASPFSFAGPKRFHPTPISIEALPPIDKVLISHNHYDHLDKQAIKALAAKTREFMVPLGVEADLIKWGVAATRIHSFDWWQEWQQNGLLIAFTPSRHFSGRGLSDGNATLWGSWVVKTPAESLYFSGDSGYFAGFKQIGHRYGPFDLSMIETGAYDHMWPDVHMQPAQSVQAHLDLGAKVMMPIHNGTFDLAFHAWYEPLEQVTQIAAAREVNLLTPVVGQVLNIRDLPAANSWWRALMPAS